MSHTVKQEQLNPVWSNAVWTTGRQLWLAYTLLLNLWKSIHCKMHINVKNIYIYIRQGKKSKHDVYCLQTPPSPPQAKKKKWERRKGRLSRWRERESNVIFSMWTSVWCSYYFGSNQQWGKNLTILHIRTQTDQPQPLLNNHSNTNMQADMEQEHTSFTNTQKLCPQMSVYIYMILHDTLQ